MYTPPDRGESPPSGEERSENWIDSSQDENSLSVGEGGGGGEVYGGRHRHSHSLSPSPISDNALTLSHLS